MARQLAVIVMAAGQGTRMRSALPKVLHPLAGVPMLGHVLATAGDLRADAVVVVVRHERDQVASVVHELLPDAVVIDQDEIPGTGRSVEVALEALPAGFDGDVVVLSSDVPLLDADTVRDLLDVHRAAANAMTLLSARFADPTGLGRIVRAHDGSFASIVEERDADDEQRAIDEVNAGVYAFALAALRRALASIGTANDQGEKYLTDAAAAIREHGGTIDARLVSDPWLVAGVNDRAQLAAVAAELNRRIVRDWMLAGVTVQDPASTWIDRTVQLSEDVTVLPNTQLLGATTVGRASRIGPDTTLVDCEVGEGATVKRTDATLAVIGDRATVGPWSYLRPGTVLDESGKIGTFVETKNAHIGPESKVPHLSYIGDAEVGEGANIGAGTITANFDGVEKHRTTIGSHVRTGSHNVFVAPVEIGDGAYTGGGAVVRKNVPPGSLALSVAPQRNVEGWVVAKRPGTAAAMAAEKALGEAAAADTATADTATADTATEGN